MKKHPDNRPREHASLRGKKIVITRAKTQAADLAAKLKVHGAEILAIPAIRIEDVDPAPILMAISRLHKYELIIFTSANAVERFFVHTSKNVDALNILAGMGKAVIGNGTKSALEKKGFTPDIIPEEFVAESLISAIKKSGWVPNNKNILLPRALEARSLIVKELEQMGASVDDIAVYKTIPENVTETSLLISSLEGTPDVLTFTSSSSVRYFDAAIPPELQNGLKNASISACIGPVTAETARRLGFRVEIVSEEHSVEALVNAIVEFYL